MTRPDPGREIQERVLAAMSTEARARIGLELRRCALVSVWQQVDERGITEPLEQARFVLRRRYPEMPEAWFQDVLDKLADDHASGRWQGFARP